MHEDYDLMNYGDGDNTPSSNFSEGEYLIHQHLGLANWCMGYCSSIYMPMEPKQIGGEKVVKSEENKDLFDELPYDADYVSTRSCDGHDLVSHVHIKKIGKRDLPDFDPVKKMSCCINDRQGCYYGMYCPVCGTLMRDDRENWVDLTKYKDSDTAFVKAEFQCPTCDTEFITDPFIMALYGWSCRVEHLARLGYFVNDVKELKQYRVGKPKLEEVRFSNVFDNAIGKMTFAAIIAVLVSMLLFVLMALGDTVFPIAKWIFAGTILIALIDFGLWVYAFQKAYNYSRTYKAPKRKYH